MASPLNIYLPGSTPVHACDARAKLVLLLAFSLSAFLVEHWVGLGLLCAVLVLCVALARIPLGRLLPMGAPVLVILGIVWVCNAFVLDVNATAGSALSGVSAGFATGMANIALLGTFGFSPQGCMMALFYACRILLILYASFVVTFTTTSDALTDAFISFMQPLRRLRFPVDDAATVLSLTLRFIPLVTTEFGRIRTAQMARGAQFGTGSLWQRVWGYSTIMIPLFVGMFRRGDRMADAMDARCYGKGVRTHLNKRRFTPANAIVLVVGLFFAVATCVLL